MAKRKDISVTLAAGIPNPPAISNTWSFEWLCSEHPDMSAWAPWAQTWVATAYDKALQNSTDRKTARPLSGAANAAAATVDALCSLFIDYLGRRACDGTWLYPKWRRDPRELLSKLETEDAEIELRSEFWEVACRPLLRKYPSPNGEDIRLVSGAAANRSKNVASFLHWLAELFNRQLNAAGGAENPRAGHYRNPFWIRNEHGSLIEDGQGKPLERVARKADKTFSWIAREIPQLRAWQPLACDYVAQLKSNVSNATSGIALFVNSFLANAGRTGTPAAGLSPAVARDPSRFMNRNSGVPDTYKSSSSTDQHIGAAVDFLDWILLNRFSEPDGRGGFITPYEFDNPLTRSEKNAGSRRSTETHRTAMPYAWVQSLRRILAQGENFNQWSWARQAQTSIMGRGADWFEVDESIIDPNDPDCVFRQRTTGANEPGSTRTFYEMWSPVRWVVILVKLTTALRTMQVRVLDSGESDEWRFDIRSWATHSSPWILNGISESNEKLAASLALRLAAHGKRRTSSDKHEGWANGALRRVTAVSEALGQYSDTVIYVNTNKTADAKLEGAAKGFDVPLPLEPCPVHVDQAGQLRRPAFASPREEHQWLDSLSRNVHYWLAKLRDWQEKYNPIERRTSWHELDKAARVTTKASEQFEMYRETCFLFREPSLKTGKFADPSLPVPNGVVDRAWWELCKELQNQFAASGKTNLDGSTIRLVVDDSGNISSTCIFDLHSIRVSLITALVVEGKIPVEVVQKLVGHSRILMTIYYTKINTEQMREELRRGLERMDGLRHESKASFLRNASIEQLRERAAFNDEDSVLRALGISTEATPGATRSASGWLEMAFGICPVGGNATQIAENRSLPGCFNGGPLLKTGRKDGRYDTYGAVEGGARNCPNCRWFVTGPSYLFGLVAKFNNTAFYLDEAKKLAMVDAKNVSDLTEKIYESEREGAADALLGGLRRQLEVAEHRAESSSTRLMDLATTLGNTHRLINRCIAILRAEPLDQRANALVLSGGEAEWTAVMSETDSELLQLSIVAQDSEVYPELDAGKAILRRSQIIDRKLMKDGLAPLFMTLSEEDQQRAGNALMKRMGQLLSPDRPAVGFLKAVKLIESTAPLADHLGLNKAAMEEELDRCLRQSPTRSLPLVFGAASAPLALT